MELPTRYDPHAHEGDVYQAWLDSGAFTPAAEPAGERFVIMIPPPNVTGVLHMGHALNNTLQDVVVRFQRMRGKDALWLPGTDHAGIATQAVVEKRLVSEGTSPRGARTRGFRRARLEVEGGARRPDPAAAAQAGRLVRLDADALHARARHVARRARGLRAPVGEGPGLPRGAPRELGLRPGHGRLGRRGRDDSAEGQAVLPALSGEGARGHLPDLGDHAARDDAGRHGGRGASRGRALREPGRRAVLAALRRPRDPDRRRHRGRPGLRHRCRQGHAGARPGGLRARRAPRAADPEHPREGRDAERERRRVRRSVPRGGPQEARGEHGRARPAREGRGLPAQRPDQRPLEDRHRTADQRAVVREDEAARGAGDRRRLERRVEDQARALDQGLPGLARERAGLVHLAPALVGAPHPGLVRRGRRPGRLARRPRAGLPAPRDRQADRPPGRGRAGHLGLLVAVALRHAGLAGPDAGPGALLQHPVPLDRARDPLPVGVAHGDGRLRAARPPADGAALPVRDLLHQRDGPGRQGQAHVEERRQRHRSDRHDRAVRRRRRAAVAGAAHARGPGRQAGGGPLRDGAALHEQGLERRRASRIAEPRRGARRRRRERADRTLEDRWILSRAGPHPRRGDRGARPSYRLQRRRLGPLPVLLGRGTATGTSSW